jgi:hypothetical protein
MPCSKPDYDRAAFWSFAPKFPDLREQAKLVQHNAPVSLAKSSAPAVHPAVKQPQAAQLAASVKAPVAPRIVVAAKTVASAPKPAAPVLAPAAAPAVAPAELAADTQKPAAFHFEIEGDDEIVDFDANQKSLETSAGKTFFVNETLVASNVANWLDEQANVHYRCDETSSCTLSLPSAATVLHATLRSHHNLLAQSQTLSMNSTAAFPIPTSYETSVGPESLGR